MRIGKGFVGIAATVALGALGLFVLLRPEAVEVEIQRVDVGPLRVTVDEDGETRVEERYVVSAPVTGLLERLECLPGDTVAEGEVVARLYPLPLDSRASVEAEARLQAAQAAWRAAQAHEARAGAAWGEAQRALDRLERVAREVPGSVTGQRMDQARTLERQAHLALEQAREETSAASHGVESARATLLGSGVSQGQPMDIRSPASGNVLRVFQECERPIVAGEPILEIGDPSALEIVVDVLTDEATRLRPGAQAWVTQTLGSDTLAARVDRIEPAAFTQVSPLGVEEQRVNVILELESSAGAVALGDRFRVEASMTVWSAEEVTRVPVSALFRLGDAWGVFVVVDGRAQRQQVRVGAIGRTHAEVLEGLEGGEPVILYPSEELEDGARVRPVG